MSTLEGGGKIVTDGLILYYDGANPQSYISGDTVCNDLSITQITGTLENGVTYDTDNNGSWVFDGLDDYIEMDEFSFSGTQITVSIWNFGERVDKKQGVFVIGTTNTGAGGVYQRCIALLIPWDNSTVYFDAGDATIPYLTGFDRISKLATTAECNGWHHWVFTKDSVTGYQRIYHDGILWHSETGKTIPLISDGLTSIGRFKGGSSEHYQQGRVSQLMIYNRELSASEVSQNYNASKARYNL